MPELNRCSMLERINNGEALVTKKICLLAWLMLWAGATLFKATDAAAADAADQPCSGLPMAGRYQTVDMEHDGELRRYQLRLPLGFDCQQRYPLLIGVHGYGGSGAYFAEQWAQVTALLDQHQVIAVFPDGLLASTGRLDTRAFNDFASRHDEGPDGLTCEPPPYGYLAFENCPADEAERTCPWGVSCADDLGFFRKMITTTMERYPIAQESIWLLGYSQGGSTVHGLAPGLSDLITAAVPMHGFSANGFARGVPGPVSYLSIWGRADRSVRADGAVGSDRLIYDSAEEHSHAWAASQSCASDVQPWPTVSDGIEGWACSQYPNCNSGVMVVSCGWDGAHDWPRNEGRDFAWDVIWSFLLAEKDSSGLLKK